MMGCSRSGHHTIINWILKNMVGFQCDWKYKLNCMGDTNVFFLGEANHDIPLSYKMVDENYESIKTLLVGYEDTPSDYTVFRDDRVFVGINSLENLNKYDIDYKGRVLFIRDFYNNLTSRIKSNEKKIFLKWDTGTPHLFNIEEKFINIWKSQARGCIENKINYLKFEDWLDHKEIRDKFLYNNFNLKDIHDIKTIRGTTSSFGSNENVKNRFDSSIIPESTKKLIREDNELHYLIGALGYEYKEI